MEQDFETERITETEITPENSGNRLDIFLSNKFTYYSRHQWQCKIKDGSILLNGEKSKNSRKLQVKDLITYQSSLKEPDVEFDYQIIAETDHYYIVNKGGNLPCHPAGPFFKNTLWHHMNKTIGPSFIINRLDRETSGLMIIGKNKEDASSLSKLVMNNQLTKKYKVFVHGHFDKEVDADGFLFNDLNSTVLKKRTFSYTASKNLKTENARTIFTPLYYIKPDNISCIECKLETGRMHQIRATLCALNFPIVGDKLYGLDDIFFLKLPNNELTDEDWTKLKISRQALHSHYLSFIDPFSKQIVEYKAPLPKELQQLKLE